MESRDSLPPVHALKPRCRRTDGEPGSGPSIAGRGRSTALPASGVLGKRLWLFPAAILILTLGAADSGLSQRVGLAPSTSCAQVVGAIKRLAAAEHHQAQALELMARGGDSALVEGKFQILLERKRELSYTLKRISMDPVASDAGVNRCLSNGYQALYQSERLSANIERILMRSRLRSQSGSPLSELGRAPAATP